MYEVFEHTADLGLRVTAPTLEELFCEAGRGLLSVIVENIRTVGSTEAVDIRLEKESPEDLFFDWLRELLYLFEVKHLLLVDFEIELGGGLRARASGEPYDVDRHELAHEVKAVTYHGFQLGQTQDGWQAEVILDI